VVRKQRRFLDRVDFRPCGEFAFLFTSEPESSFVVDLAAPCSCRVFRSELGFLRIFCSRCGVLPQMVFDCSMPGFDYAVSWIGIHESYHDWDLVDGAGFGGV
jgi:hypothetical protein